MCNNKNGTVSLQQHCWHWNVSWIDSTTILITLSWCSHGQKPLAHWIDIKRDLGIRSASTYIVCTYVHMHKLFISCMCKYFKGQLIEPTWPKSHWIDKNKRLSDRIMLSFYNAYKYQSWHYIKFVDFIEFWVFNKESVDTCLEKVENV